MKKLLCFTSKYLFESDEHGGLDLSGDESGGGRGGVRCTTQPHTTKQWRSAALTSAPHTPQQLRGSSRTERGAMGRQDGDAPPLNNNTTTGTRHPTNNPAPTNLT